jgi:hypothetical protein
MLHATSPSWKIKDIIIIFFSIRRSPHDTVQISGTTTGFTF